MTVLKKTGVLIIVLDGVRTIALEENYSLVRVRVRIKVWEQFSSEVIVLEPFCILCCKCKVKAFVN